MQSELTRTRRGKGGRGARLCNCIWGGRNAEGLPATLLTAREEQGCMAAMWVLDKRHSLVSTDSPSQAEPEGIRGGCVPERFEVFKYSAN